MSKSCSEFTTFTSSMQQALEYVYNQVVGKQSLDSILKDLNDNEVGNHIRRIVSILKDYNEGRAPLFEYMYIMQDSDMIKRMINENFIAVNTGKHPAPPDDLSFDDIMDDTPFNLIDMTEEEIEVMNVITIELLYALMKQL